MGGQCKMRISRGSGEKVHVDIIPKNTNLKDIQL